jgi:tripartite-type tricarboxylate transporter receptor subunit TctC
VLVVASAQRLQDAPQYPTLAETFPGFDVSAFQALAVPKGVPPAVIEKISADIRSVVSSPEFAEKVGPLGVFPKATSPQRARELAVQSPGAEWDPIRTLQEK